LGISCLVCDEQKKTVLVKLTHDIF
jgi:NUBPL iron-transfer P-loop NTPase